MAKINKDLLNELWTSVDISWSNHGRYVSDIYYDYDADSIDGFDEDYIAEQGITPEIFEATKQYLEDLIYEAKYYEDGYTMYLQLHDNHTLYDIDNPNFTDQDYYDLTMTVSDEFEEQTGIEVYGLGRSGRHICVDLTLENLENYKDLVDTALELEKWFIEQANDTEIYN